MELEDQYKTRNFYLSTVLLYMGAQLVKIEKDPNRKGQAKYFVFAGNVDFEQVEKDYYNKQLECEPNKLFFHYKELKTRLYE